jgi:hypothetical protein
MSKTFKNHFFCIKKYLFLLFLNKGIRKFHKIDLIVAFYKEIIILIFNKINKINSFVEMEISVLIIKKEIVIFIMGKNHNNYIF